MILIETLEDRREYQKLFYSTSTFADYNKVLGYARDLTSDPTIGPLIEAMLNKLG
jgi:hypothetical protein